MNAFDRDRVLRLKCTFARQVCEVWLSEENGHFGFGVVRRRNNFKSTPKSAETLMKRVGFFVVSSPGMVNCREVVRSCSSGRFSYGTERTVFLEKNSHMMENDFPLQKFEGRIMFSSMHNGIDCARKQGRTTKRICEHMFCFIE